MRVVLVDNYDSFTFNLANQVRTTGTGVRLEVLANDDERLRSLTADDVDAVIISAGPGSPSDARDVGLCASLLERLDETPVLGICLGHQLIALAAGGQVELTRPRHGHVSTIRHTGDGLFRGMGQEFPATRYHSFAVRAGAAGMTETAWAEDGVVMGIEDDARPRWGVQFHPESIETHAGRYVVENFLELARLHTHRPASAAAEPQPDTAPAVATQPEPRVQVVSREVRGPFDPAVVFETCFGQAPAAFWLDDNGLARAGRSYLGSASGGLAETLTYRVGEGVKIRDRNGSHTVDGDIWSLLEQRTASTGHSDAGPLAGGYVGFLGYGCKADIDGGTRHPVESPEPDAVWMRPDRVVEHDAATGDLVLRALATADATDRTDAEQWLADTAARLDGLRHARADVPSEPSVAWPAPEAARSDREYLEDVATCFVYLTRGESYEICLTNQLSLDPVPDPFALYLRMRAGNPTSRSAYLRVDELYVASTSPEQFVSVDRQRRISTRPIKGTVERGRDQVDDRRLRTELEQSPKTRAENRMIVDLVRNDLNRVCRPGSVQVPQYLEVESYETLHQLVSTVVGELRPETTTVAAVKSCFPPGSMTGAPKVRTMELIDRLEPRPRGVYSGALGYFGADGTVDLSVVIRTAVATPGRLTVGTGGAITLDSDPVSELEEAALKARTLLAAHAGLMRRPARNDRLDDDGAPTDVALTERTEQLAAMPPRGQT
jgi:para-aminobenzoate synthetase